MFLIYQIYLWSNKCSNIHCFYFYNLIPFYIYNVKGHFKQVATLPAIKLKQKPAKAELKNKIETVYLCQVVIIL